MCAEDCAYCTQSSKYNVDIEKYSKKPIETIVAEAKAAKEMGAVGFCLVTAGRGLNSSKLKFVTEAARAVNSEVEGLHLIACNGTAQKEHLDALFEAGLGSYNHNLEASERFFPEICTTHTWKERYETCIRIKESGLGLCTGGIFGMGEIEKDRISMLETIRDLGAETVPLNFYHANPALPIHAKKLETQEALDIITMAREILGNQVNIMVAGGREVTFHERQGEIFAAGASAMVIGNYLTTGGEKPATDLKMLEDLGLEIASACHES